MVYGNWVPFSFWIAKFLFLCQMYKPGIWSFFSNSYMAQPFDWHIQ